MAVVEVTVVPHVAGKVSISHAWIGVNGSDISCLHGLPVLRCLGLLHAGRAAEDIPGNFTRRKGDDSLKVTF